MQQDRQPTLPQHNNTKPPDESTSEHEKPPSPPEILIASTSPNPQNQQTTISPSASHKQQIQQELEAMQFEPDLIYQALTTASTLEEAIQTIISLIQAQEQQQIASNQEVQLILVVRMDLKMGMGKIAAQCAHAILRAFQIGRAQANNQMTYTETFIEWLQKGKTHVVYKVEDEQQLFNVLGEAKSRGALTTYIRDAGRTQIAAGSATVGAIGPVAATKLRPVTQVLRLL